MQIWRRRRQSNVGSFCLNMNNSNRKDTLQSLHSLICSFHLICCFNVEQKRNQRQRNEFAWQILHSRVEIAKFPWKLQIHQKCVVFPFVCVLSDGFMSNRWTKIRKHVLLVQFQFYDLERHLMVVSEKVWVFLRNVFVLSKCPCFKH